MKVSRQKISRVLGIGLLAGGLIAGQGFWGEQVKAMEFSVGEAKTLKTKSEQGDQLVKINSYEELVKVLKENQIITKDKRYLDRQNTGDMSMASLEVSNTASKATDGASSAISYSTTNVQVNGVDEADTLKNDDRYIYQKIGNNKIAIVDTKEMLKTVSIIEAKEGSDVTFDTMFLDNNQLIIVGRKTQISKAIKEERARTNGDVYTYTENHYKNFSLLQVYDLNNKSAPKLIREIEVEGSLSEARKIDQTVYMLTRKHNDYVLEDKFMEEDILPYYKDSLIGNTLKMIVPDHIWYQPWNNARYSTLITALQLDEKKPIEVQVVLGTEDQIYMNKEALYLTSYNYDYRGEPKTYISKYNVDKQKVTYTATGNVKGMILNQFSMDEYKENFRIATTNHSANSNAVYVLDNRMKIIGQLENLAPGEKIYSVRFIGEKGYVVTFKQVDPLFVIDLSSPRMPKILGELKVPGFSQYLHPIGDHLVVGIGKSTADVIRRDENGNEIVTGMTTAGIKLSLFDVSNPMYPKEVNHIILGTNGSYSGAAENHKMVTVHNDKQLLAIPIFIHYDEALAIEDFKGAYVFGIEKGKLVGKAKLGKVGQYSSYYDNSDRVCYIGDKLYFLYDNKINEYESVTFSRIQTLQLD